MPRAARFFAPFLVLLAVLTAPGCSNSNRQLQSVALTPASADAKDFANGEVPFAAAGTFSQPPSPSPLTSADVLWCVGGTNGACSPSAQPYPSVDQNGVAQCGPTFAGTATVLAGTPLPGAADNAVLKVFGSAQLTCP